MQLLVCGRSSLRRKPIEAVFKRAGFFGAGIPRARVLWVVFLAAEKANGRDDWNGAAASAKATAGQALGANCPAALGGRV